LRANPWKCFTSLSEVGCHSYTSRFQPVSPDPRNHRTQLPSFKKTAIAPALFKKKTNTFNLAILQLLASKDQTLLVQQTSYCMFTEGALLELQYNGTIEAMFSVF
jgi:hypothetical protein